MIPAQTTPLAKGIKTTEGVLAVVLNVALGVAAVPAIHVISPKVAAICATVTSLGLTAQRGLIKVQALSAGAGAVQDVVDSPDPLKQIAAEVEAADPQSALSPTPAQ